MLRIALGSPDRATGDGGYLNDAKQFFGAYQSSPESLQSPNLIVDWNNNYWSTAILLASQVRLFSYPCPARLAPPAAAAGRRKPLLP